ncbi:hypothetical protein SASPL_118030 [Salvia splendens]|uniref:Uncharacterized protein n=1 Tax=Salvia splendens TaxID=180675 RepID=A0A8X8XZJ1_SALSN|nr:hypothetical protein SASPL_118030 [Salvia splendens]
MSGVTSTKGNGIIVTTRIDNVASVVNSFHVHLLKGLSVLVHNGNAEVPSGFETIGKEMDVRVWPWLPI